jgi:hypothetical protein
MTRHLVDKRAPSEGGRMKEFLRIARAEGDRFWQVLWRSPRPVAVESRRTAEFLRIARRRAF